MPDFPKVSVITTCLNAVKEIDRTLSSVVSQNYPNLEYIVVDGASTDGTLGVIYNYRSKIDYLSSEPDKGLYHGMNKGLQIATGDFIFFMNAGDTFFQHTTLIDLIEMGKHADFIYGKPLVIEKNGSLNGWHKLLANPAEITPSDFSQGMMVCHQALMIRRSLAPEFSLQYKVAADIDWTIRALKNSKSTYYYNQYVCHYYRGGFSSQHRWRAIGERFLIVTYHFGFIQSIASQLKIISSWIKPG